ncbi:DNA-binding response regulator [Bombiscardovia apis]|uniref:DNA-binding response regulator n=1 Tax=Bombiscardovia apis TaxID=2932182 RepID=A0ABN6SKJ7_9BIFI|nr:response regulator transcription factor [Bombiscardovia apis]BDR55235.1 DNA-binding response regulator [Bombiscardovia apis]
MEHTRGISASSEENCGQEQPIPAPIRVSIVDDDPMICQAMALIINTSSSGRVTVISTAQNAADALKHAQKEHPDIVLMDLAMPGISGIEATAKLRSLPNPPHVLVLTSLSPSTTVEHAVEAGAEGFISKTDPPEEIVDRIIGAYSGDPQFNLVSQRQLITRLTASQPMTRRNEARTLLYSLTDRERQATLLAAEGYTNQEIAERMYVSERTVKAHLSSTCDKLCMSRVQLARLVERADLDTTQTEPGID